MEKWERIKLSEVLKEKTERNKNNETDLVLSVTNSQGFVKQSDFFEGTVHSEDISNYKLVRKNEFAYNPSRINVGSIDILKDYDIGALSPMYVIFSVDETRLLPDYFKYYFQTHKFNENVKNNTQGSVRNSLSFKALSEFEYLLPPLEEQKRIVKILDQVNKIIEKYQNLINEKEQFIKSQFVEMFGNPILNNKNLKIVKISEISLLKAGKNIKTAEIKYEYKDGYFPCYGGNGIRGFVNKKSHNGNYPIIGRQGALAGNVNYAKGEFYATEHAVVAMPIIEMNTLWFYYALIYLDLMRFQTGAAQPGLAVENLNKVDIPLPSIKSQNQFALSVELIDKQKFHSVLKNIIKVKESEVYA